MTAWHETTLPIPGKTGGQLKGMAYGPFLVVRVRSKTFDLWHRKTGYRLLTGIRGSFPEIQQQVRTFATRKDVWDFSRGEPGDGEGFVKSETARTGIGPATMFTRMVEHFPIK